jgi:putative transposase
MAGGSGYPARMTTLAPNRYAGHRFSLEIISRAVWLYFRFPLSLRMVEEMLAARGTVVSHKAVRQWAPKFGQGFANEIHRRLPRAGAKWHLDEVVIKIAGTTHWLSLAVDQHGIMLDVLVQRRRPPMLHAESAEIGPLQPRSNRARGMAVASAQQRYRPSPAHLVVQPIIT